MKLWWYEHADNQKGPVEIDKLSELIQTKQISTDTLVWNEGMPNWKPLNQIEELKHLIILSPPPLPKKHEENSDLNTQVEQQNTENTVKDNAKNINLEHICKYKSANMWRRFFARIFDVWWQLMLIAFTSAFILGYVSNDFSLWLNKPNSENLFTIYIFPLVFIFDAIIYRLFGNTPGKALLGVEIQKPNGEKLTFKEYLQRNISLWITGFGFGIPIVNAILMIRQAYSLRTKKFASYDEQTKNKVISKGSNGLRVTLFVILFTTIFLFLAFLNGIEQSDQIRKNTSFEHSNQYWKNPLTEVTTKLSNDWHAKKQVNKDEQDIYTFTSLNGNLVIFFAVENLQSANLPDYVIAFRTSVFENIQFNDGGRFYSIANHDAWIAKGKIHSDLLNNIPVKVEIRKYGSYFWRTIYMDSLNSPKSKQKANELTNALWKTLR